MHGGACLRGIFSWGRRRAVQSCKEAAHGAGYWLYKSSVGFKERAELSSMLTWRCSGVGCPCSGLRAATWRAGVPPGVSTFWHCTQVCVCNILHRRMQQAGRACGLAARRLPRRLPKVLEMHAARAFFEVFADCTDVLIGTMMS